MGTQNSWNQGRQDANSGKQPANKPTQIWQEQQAYNAGYKHQQQQNQTGKK